MYIFWFLFFNTLEKPTENKFLYISQIAVIIFYVTHFHWANKKNYNFLSTLNK